jgi:hypothetical protein
MGLSSRSLSLLSWPLRALLVAARAMLAVSRFARRWRFRPSALHGCVLWLRPERGISSTWGLVTRWTDRRRGIALVARAPTECPTFVDQSSGLHDRPALRFDDGGGLLETPGTVPMSLEGQLTVFLVLSPSRPSARVCAAFSGPPPPRGRQGRGLRAPHPAVRPRLRALSWTFGCRVLGIELDGHNELLASVDEAQVHTTGVRLMAGRPYLLGLIFSGHSAAVIVNGARVTTFAIDREVAGAFTARLRLGSGRGVRDRFSGDVGDILIYDRALDALECAAVAATLTERYGIGRPRRPRTIDRFRRILHRVRDRIANACYGNARPE